MKKMILILKVRMIMSCTRVVMMVIRQHLCFLLKGVKHCMTNLNYPHNVVFIFQPAEETGGGANRLIKAGAFDKYPIEAVFGFHVNPFEKEGKIVIRDEEITASATEYRFFLKGLSSHVADKEQGHSCGEGYSMS